MVRIDRIMVFCEVPSDDLKRSHRDIENEFRNYLKRLDEVSKQKGLKLLSPYFTRNKKEYYFQNYSGIKDMVFFADALGLKRMCMTANMANTFKRFIGRGFAVILICNSHDGDMIDLMVKGMKIPKERIIEVMVEGGELGFKDSVRAVEIASSL